MTSQMRRVLTRSFSRLLQVGVQGRVSSARMHSR